MHLHTLLGIWSSVGLGWCALLSKGYALIPTKTSRFWNQLSGSVPLHFNSFSHVFFASLVKFLSRLDWCAVILSVVSHSFITLFHLLFTPCWLGAFSCITLLHWSTHIRWAASDSMIWRSLRDAFFFGVGCMFSLFSFGFSG
jgi:hypothetical protein